jgi:hypothetical protein
MTPDSLPVTVPVVPLVCDGASVTPLVAVREVNSSGRDVDVEVGEEVVVGLRVGVDVASFSVLVAVSLDPPTFDEPDSPVSGVGVGLGVGSGAETVKLAPSVPVTVYDCPDSSPSEPTSSSISVSPPEVPLISTVTTRADPVSAVFIPFAVIRTPSLSSDG